MAASSLVEFRPCGANYAIYLFSNWEALAAIDIFHQNEKNDRIIDPVNEK
jgi:hypothetical protein